MVLLIASGGQFRLPIAIAPIDPEIKGHQNKLFRHLLTAFEPPAWVTEVIVTGDAGFCANETLRLINDKGWSYVFAMARTRKCTNGKYVSDLACHLPRHCYGRRATSTPDGRRRDFWVFQRRATLHQLGDVTIVFSKKRRHHGPKHVRRFVTNLLEVKAGTVLSLYAWRWGVEVTIKELTGGLHLGQRQVTSDKDRVKRSVALPVCASLRWVRLYGHEASLSGPWSLFRLKQRFMVDMANAQGARIETRW